MKKKIFKFLIISIFLFIPFIFIHTGFFADSFVKNIQSVVFALALSFTFTWSQYRKYIFLIALFLVVGMSIFFIFDVMDWADILGSSGVGLVAVLILSYLPELIKKGYIEKL